MNAAQTFPSGSNHWPQAHALNWLSMAGPELHIEQNMVPIILNEKEESLIPCEIMVINIVHS